MNARLRVLSCTAVNQFLHGDAFPRVGRRARKFRNDFCEVIYVAGHLAPAKRQSPAVSEEEMQSQTRQSQNNKTSPKSSPLF